LQAVVISFLSVALAEFGDKTQLLAILLASRFRKPLPIIAGILAATIVNHLIAATGGYYLADLLEGFGFRLIVALSFVAMGLWTLVPDKQDQELNVGNFGAFLTTLIGIFVLEIGDKTQIATVALAAHFHSVVLVATGTTLGMLAADVPAVLLADRMTSLVPLRVMRAVAALIFIALGVWGLVDLLYR
jgi:putative Ca2+/H+ antiporter (TMEM165/GDT1 family)